MIAPELEKLLLDGTWFYGQLDSLMQQHGPSLSPEDLPKIEKILTDDPYKRNREGILNKMGEYSSIPKTDLIRLAHRLTPHIEVLGTMNSLFSGVSKEDLDQLADEGAIVSSTYGMGTSTDDVNKSHKYATKSVIQSLRRAAADILWAAHSVPKSLTRLAALFQDGKGDDKDKQELANEVLDVTNRLYAGSKFDKAAPAAAYLFRTNPEALLKAGRLPIVGESQQMADAAIEYSKKPNPNPQLIDWALTRPRNVVRGVSLRGEGERLANILAASGLPTSHIFNFEDHGIPFQKMLDNMRDIDSPTFAARNASYKDGDEDALYRLVGEMTGTGNHQDIVQYLQGMDQGAERSGITRMLENITRMHGGMDYSELALHQNPGKYNLSNSQQEEFANYLSHPGRAPHAPHKKILSMQNLKPSIIGAIMRAFSEHIKGKTHKMQHGSLAYGVNHFSDRSLSSEGHYTGDDPSLHPQDVVNVRVGSTVLRKLRDHLEKLGGRLRPEELPKGETWNTIVKEFKDKAGNVNYATDWNPLRASDGKLDAKVIQSYIDSMPVRPFVLSYSTWSHPIQRHSKAKSNVVIANLHPDTIEALKKEGLYGKFLEKTLGDIDTVHPLGRDSIGWIRFTGDHKKGFHVDEVQSDLYGELRKSNDPDHKRIAQIVFGDAHPSEILHEVAQEYFRRDPKNIGTPWATHTVASKSPMALEEAKEAPVHFKVSYEQAPKRLGAKPSTYGTLRTQTGDNPKYATEYALNGKPTWQDEIRKFEVPEPVDGRRQCVAIVVQNSDGKVLLGRGHDGLWNITAGKCEPGEPHLRAAVREMFEESGLRPKDMEYHGLLPDAIGGVDLHCYTANAEGMPHGNFDPDAEFVDYTWVDPNGGEIEQYLPVMRFPPDVLLHVGVMKAGR